MLVAVFLLGAVTGGAGWHALGARAQAQMFDGSRHGVFVWSLERKLDLTAVQKQQIVHILTEYDRATDSLRKPDPRLATLKEQMRGELRARLTPEQQAKYDAMVRARDAARGGGRLSAPSGAR